MLGIGALCALCRSVSILRVFSNTRNLVRMILEIMKEMWSFMVVLFVSVFGFATLMVVAMKLDSMSLPATIQKKNKKTGKMVNVTNKAKFKMHNITFTSTLKQEFIDIYAGFEPDDYLTAAWVIFIFKAILIPIVMLNMLIAIMQDTFDRVMMTSKAADYKEKAGLILDIEQMLFWNENKGERSYLHVVRYASPDNSGNIWQGKVKEIKDMVGQVQEQLEEQYADEKSVQNSIVKSLKRSERSMKVFVTKREKKMGDIIENLEEKLNDE